MKTIYILCEGQTEESFVNNVLYDYMQPDFFVYPIIFSTKRTSETKYKGGIVSYQKFLKEVKRLCNEHPKEIVTTMIDFYGLPDDFPGVGVAGHDPYDQVNIIECRLGEDVKMWNFMPNIIMHEFEALLFSNTKAFDLIQDGSSADMESIKLQFSNNPELINNSKETSPSKRILKHINHYSKVTDGTRIAVYTGILEIMNHCPKFKTWIDRLKKSNAIYKNHPKNQQ